MGVPLTGQFQDSDQTPTNEYLHYLTPLNRLAAPEYFLPPGMTYDPCMTDGGCSEELLGQVYTTTYPITAHYLQVERLTDAGLQRMPLRQAGKTFGAPAQETIHTFLPIAASAFGRELVGWFHQDGRMVDIELTP
jgi:hypothetical protein